MSIIQTHLNQHISVIEKLSDISAQIEEFAKIIYTAVSGQGTIYWCGNGGSAGDAQHLSAELMGRYVKERKGLRSFALTTDSSLLTAVANDYDFTRIFARQIETVARHGDVVVVISTSGNSSNIIAAAAAARASGAIVVGLTGSSGGKMRELCDLCLCIPSTVVSNIQECHGLIGHIACDLIDKWITESEVVTNDSELIKSKILSRSGAITQCQTWRDSGKRIVFTNGCFDLLHVGHVRLLEQSRALGDRLIVGLNNDESVRFLKGHNRPLNNEYARSHVLSALSAVDAVVIFGEGTPRSLIMEIKPNVLVKGSDYTEDTVIGATEVKTNGGEVVIIDLLGDYSTTGLIEKMKDQKIFFK